MKNSNLNCTALIFNENESLLSQAQTALYRLRLKFEKVNVLARGNASGVALALAAQLPVDRLFLWDCRLYAVGRMLRRSGKLGAELARLNSFARRNLSLVIAPVTLLNTDGLCARRIARGLSASVPVETLEGSGAMLRLAGDMPIAPPEWLGGVLACLNGSGRMGSGME